MVVATERKCTEALIIEATCWGDAAKKPVNILILLIGGASEAIRLVTFYYQASRAETLSICQATMLAALRRASRS